MEPNSNQLTAAFQQQSYSIVKIAILHLVCVCVCELHRITKPNYKESLFELQHICALKQSLKKSKILLLQVVY